MDGHTRRTTELLYQYRDSWVALMNECGRAMKTRQNYTQCATHIVLHSYRPSFKYRKYCFTGYWNNCFIATVIVERIKDTRAPFYRPSVPHQESEGVNPDILTLMKQCWNEEPSDRPSFDEIAKIFKTINKGKSVQFVSNVRISFQLFTHWKVMSLLVKKYLATCQFYRNLTSSSRLIMHTNKQTHR